MWDFFETVRHRHSVRKYHADIAVEKSKVHAILEMACAAPSAGDLQSYRVIVVNDAAVRAEIQQAAENQNFISEAPISLVFCADAQRSAEKFGSRGAELYAVQDATIAAAYAQLAVVAAEMGSTWIGKFDAAEVCKILQLDENLLPVAILSVGYPAELPEPTPRRRIDDVVMYR